MAKKPAAEKIDGDYMMSGDAEEFTAELFERAEVAGSITSPTRALKAETLKKGAVKDILVSGDDIATTGEKASEKKLEINSSAKPAATVKGASSKTVSKQKREKKNIIPERRNSIIFYDVPTELYIDFLTCLHNCRHLYKSQRAAFEHILNTFVGEIKPQLGAFFDNARKCEMIDYQAKAVSKKSRGEE